MKTFASHVMIGLIAIACIAVTALPASAGSFHLQNAWCMNPFAAGSGACTNTLLVSQSGPLDSSFSYSFTGYSAGAANSATMTESSYYGALSASGNGQATANGVGNGSSDFLGPNIGDGYVAFYQDDLTITGSGPVTLVFTETFSDTVGWTDPLHWCPSGVCASMTDSLFVSGTTTGGGALEWDPLLTSSGTVTQTATFDPGTRISIMAGLGDVTNTGWGGLIGRADCDTGVVCDATVNYSGSDSLTIQASGGGFTSDSGATYSAVPEPASLFLLGTGLASLAGLKKSRLFSVWKSSTRTN